MCARETGREGGRWESAALKGLRCGMRGAFRSREGRTPRPVVSSIFCPDRHGPRVLLGRLGVPTRGERGKPPAFRSPRGSRLAEASAWGRRGRGGSGASSASAARGGGCGERSLGPLRSHPRPARQAARPGPSTPAAAHVRRPPPRPNSGGAGALSAGLHTGQRAPRAAPAARNSPSLRAPATGKVGAGGSPAGLSAPSPALGACGGGSRGPRAPVPAVSSPGAARPGSCHSFASLGVLPTVRGPGRGPNGTS